MGKLYDKRDLGWNLAFWDREEQKLAADIANKLLSASVLDAVITYPATRFRPARHLKVRDSFDYERKRERFKLLMTGRLLAELADAQREFKACKHCYTTITGKQRACDEHKDALTAAKSNVWWAGQRNLMERLQRGQARPDDTEGTKQAPEVEALPDVDEPRNPLNKWERWYSDDKKNGVWKDADRDYYIKQYGSCDYFGWLQMMREEEEISEADFLVERQRVRDELEEVAASAPAVAGTYARITRKNV